MLLLLKNIEPVPADITYPETGKWLKKKQGKTFFKI
jgi:hypothetical protein